MAYDFNKLTAAVKTAVEAGDAAAEATPDRGTCNMDGVLLRIPRIKEERVVAALQEAGVRTEKYDWGWHGTGYMINPPSGGQADRRTAAAEAIKNSLRESGYDVGIYYQID